MDSSCLQDVNQIRAALRRRDELLLSKDVPRQSELYQSIGDSLGHIVINNMNVLSKELMGVTNPLKGPPNDLWVEPSSRIENKVRLTPPSSTDVVKGFLHQGILEIGEKMEAKVERNCLERIQKASKETSEFERFECERRLKFSLDCERKKYMQSLKNMEEEYKAALFAERNALQREFEASRCEYLRKYRCFCQEIAPKVQTQGTQTDYVAEPVQIDEMASKKFETLNKTMRCLWDDFKEHLRIQRHIMTCSKITELIHVICAQKLDAQQKMDKVKQLCSAELNRIAGKSGYTLIKEKYITLLKNINTFIQLASVKDFTHKEFLVQFRNEIERDIVDIEFEENLCHCCKDIKELMQENVPVDSRLRSRAGIVIFSKSLGRQIFCTCQSTSEEEDNELKDSLSSRRIPPHDVVGAEWSTVSEGNDESHKSATLSGTESSATEDLPITSDIVLARKIASLINIENILVNAFDKIILQESGYIAIETLQNKVFEYVSQEFGDSFNQDVIMSAIGTITNQRKHSDILAARDSLELVKARRSTKTELFIDKPFAAMPCSKEDVTSSCSSSSYFSHNTVDNMAEYAEQDECEDQENESEIGISKDVIRLSELHRAKCPDFDNTDTKDIYVKDPANVRQFWESFIKMPKYMMPPESWVDPNWIYHKTTEDEWIQLMEKIGEKEAVDVESSSVSYESSSKSSEQLETVDPKLVNEAIQAYEKCLQDTVHPIGKVRIRSLIDMLERNEDITKILYKSSHLNRISQRLH